MLIYPLLKKLLCLVSFFFFCFAKSFTSHALIIIYIVDKLFVDFAYCIKNDKKKSRNFSCARLYSNVNVMFHRFTRHRWRNPSSFPICTNLSVWSRKNVWLRIKIQQTCPPFKAIFLFSWQIKVKKISKKKRGKKKEEDVFKGRWIQDLCLFELKNRGDKKTWVFILN